MQKGVVEPLSRKWLTLGKTFRRRWQWSDISKEKWGLTRQNRGIHGNTVTGKRRAHITVKIIDVMLHVNSKNLWEDEMLKIIWSNSLFFRGEKWDPRQVTCSQLPTEFKVDSEQWLRSLAIPPGVFNLAMKCQQRALFSWCAEPLSTYSWSEYCWVCTLNSALCYVLGHADKWDQEDPSFLGVKVQWYKCELLMF